MALDTPALESLLQSGPPMEEMRATFPGLGVMSDFIEGISESQGSRHRLVPPAPNSLKTLNLGTTYAPEGACLPFKLILGSLMQSFERGANTVAMINENGPCRLGFYSLGLRLVFSDLDLDKGWFDFSNESIREGYVGRYRRSFKKAFGRPLTLTAAALGFFVGFARLAALERLENRRNHLLPFELEQGALARCYAEGRKAIQKARSIPRVWSAYRKTRTAFAAVPLDLDRPSVKVLLTGEIFCSIDPFSNANIEARLGRLGAIPIRVLWQTTHLLYALKLDLFRRHGKRSAIRAARKYLPEQLGGDCNSNLGHAILAHRHGFDGMVHLKPFACLLEFVSEHMLEVFREETGFPILSLPLDDLTGEERIEVRLEAFVDSLFRQKRDSRGERSGR